MKIVRTKKWPHLLISQWWPSNSTLQSHATFPVSCIRHLPPCLHKFSPCGKHRSICNNNIILMFDVETRSWIKMLYTVQSWYSINNNSPIWHKVPSNLVSHSQLISPYSPIEQFPPFLHIFMPPGEHLSNSNISNSMHCNLLNKFQNNFHFSWYSVSF